MSNIFREIGTDNAEFVAESERWLDYDLPPALAGRLWGGGYRGQSQKWFALRFLGTDSDIELDAHHSPEFVEWRWAEIDELPSLIVDFKRPVYRALVAEFRHLAEELAKNG